MPDSPDDGRRARTADDTVRGSVACPFCGSEDSELVSLFGSQLLVSQLRCRACRSYFEAVRDDHWQR